MPPAATTVRHHHSDLRAGQPLMLLAFAAGLLFAAGCVRRTLTINTVPQGATVWLNDEEVGKAPVSVDFLWYGDYDVTARLTGYETLHTHQDIAEPWYQWAGVDFFAEVLWPGWIHDERSMNFAMIPAPEPDRAQLLEAAQAFRERTLATDE